MIPHCVIALAGSLLFVPLCSATPLTFSRSTPILDSDQAMNFTLEGKITAINGTKLTVNTEENIVFHVRYDDKTEIKKKDGSPAEGKDLRIGVRISVGGDLEESGEILAKKIEIEAEGPQNKLNDIAHH